mgnify:CR=1 FL=1
MKNLKIGIGVLLIANIRPVISISVYDFIGSEYSTVQSYVIGFFFNIGLTIFIALYNLISWLFEDL